MPPVDTNTRHHLGHSGIGLPQAGFSMTVISATNSTNNGPLIKCSSPPPVRRICPSFGDATNGGQDRLCGVEAPVTDYRRDSLYRSHGWGAGAS